MNVNEVKFVNIKTMIDDRKILVVFKSEKDVYNLYYEHSTITGWNKVSSEKADFWRKDNCKYRVHCIKESENFNRKDGLIYG